MYSILFLGGSETNGTHSGSDLDEKGVLKGPLIFKYNVNYMSDNKIHDYSDDISIYSMKNVDIGTDLNILNQIQFR